MLPESRSTLLVGALLVAGALAAPGVAAHGGGHGSTVHIALEAGEAGDCPDGSYCFKVLSGDLSKVTGGTSVELTLENPSGNGISHNAHVTQLSNAAENHEDTPTSAAYANTTDVSPGNSATINFTVPDGVDSSYIWCDIVGHESGGMWLKVGAAAAGGGGNGGDGGGNGSPGFGAAAALVGAGAALALAGRRRD